MPEVPSPTIKNHVSKPTLYRIPPKHFEINVEGEIVKRHIDHLLRREETDNENVSFACKNKVLDNEDTVQSEPCVISTGEDKMMNEPVDVDVNVSAPNVKSDDTKAVPSNKDSACQIGSERNIPDLNVSTRPSRERKMPSYLKDCAKVKGLKAEFENKDFLDISAYVIQCYSSR